MGKRKSSSTRKVASERDQFWLDHEAAQVASGQTAKDYAAAHGVSLHAFYQARKRLRTLGLLAPAVRQDTSARKSPRRTAVSFSQIKVARAMNDMRFRVELPGGIALEWSGGEVPESVVVLLERLARPA